MGLLNLPEGLKLFSVFHYAFFCDRMGPTSSKVLAKDKKHACEIFNAIRAKKMKEPQWYYREWNEVKEDDITELPGLGVLNPNEATAPTELLKPVEKKV